jgi:hypothetical protein
MVRRVALLALLLAGCEHVPGQRYELQVYPSPRSLVVANALDVILQRDNGERQRSGFPLPHPSPAPPWLLDVQTHDWGAASLQVEVVALGAEGNVAYGVGAPRDGVIVVQLADVSAGDDLALPPRLDFATLESPDAGPPPPDAAAGDIAVAGDGPMPDLTGASPPDLGTVLPDLRGVVVDLASVVGDLAAAPSCSTVTLPAEADAELSYLATNSNFGSDQLFDFSTGEYVIYRFDVTTVPATASIQSIGLRLGYSPNGCSTNCYSCSIYDANATPEMRFMSSDWDEATVTYNNRRTGMAWNVPGAEGAPDRSATVAGHTMHTAHADTTIPVDAAALGELATWRQSNRVTLQVTVAVQDAMTITSRETGKTCTAGTTPALVVRYCL